jgi:hypothetical protein
LVRKNVHWRLLLLLDADDYLFQGPVVRDSIHSEDMLHADTYPDAHAAAANAEPNANRYADTYPDSNANGNSYTYGHANGYADSNTNGNTNIYADTNSHTDGYCYA